MIAELIEALPDRPFLLMEKPHVCLGLTWRAVSTDTVADAIASLMEKQGWPTAAFVAHSYGTFVASRIIQLHRPRVESVVRARVTPFPPPLPLLVPDPAQPYACTNAQKP